MNPDNKALDRTYFIAGPPRVGKTLLSYKLAEKIRGHVVTTDAIRSAAKRACTDKNSDIFRINKENDLPEEEWLSKHLEHPEMVVEDQNRESVAFWPSIIAFCNNFCEDNANHIVEGVALLPSLVSQMKDKPAHIVYVGNTSEEHLKSMLDFSKKFPEQDWMAAMGYSEKKIEGMAKFVKEMSQYFKSEAEKYGFPYFEIKDYNFEGSLEDICDFLCK
jgi:2-phosphoglycerate kinase